jgi:ABC-2 type transport system ATP-binding protein
MNVISVRDLVKRFGDLVAVDHVSFEVAPGEVFALLGPNGAGKTTTINVLCTLERPTSGEVSIDGFDVGREQDRVRKSIGLVFQDPSLDEKLTGLQNLNFHAMVYAVPRSVRDNRIEQALRMVELWDRRNNEVRTYSGGMKRRLELARGLLHHPRVLFLDEPTLGLDPQTRNRIWDYVLDLRRSEGTTIFLTTHYMDEADRADRIAIMDRGRLVAMDTPQGLKSLVAKDILVVKTGEMERATEEMRARYDIEARRDGDTLSFEVAQGDEFLPHFLKEFSTGILSVSLRRPTLEDVFLTLTGREIREEDVSDTFRSLARQHGRRMRNRRR